MQADRENTAKGVNLRSRAEQRVRLDWGDPKLKTRGALLTAVHELRVHQVELELQNELLRATQADLEAARELYLDLYESAPVAYLTLDRQSQILAANLTSTIVLGTARGPLLSLPLAHFVFQGDLRTFDLWLRSVFESPTPQSCEVRYRPAGGAVRWARLEAAQVKHGDDASCRLALSDITEQKLAEEAVRASERAQIRLENEERLCLALDAGELGAWDHDLKTGKVICSDRGRAILGLAPDEPATWERFLARVHPEDRPGFLSATGSSLDPQGRNRFATVFRIILPDGAIRWLRFSARDFRAPGLPSGAVRRTGVLADITREKETEGLLQSRAKQLEGLVQQRTARLQEAVTELEHFSYTLIHDLRAPLRAIRGYGELVLAQCPNLSPTHRQFLERSGHAAERMDQMVVEALNYSQLVRQRFTLAPVDCHVLVQGLLDSYPQFQEARARISIAGTLPAVMGNAALLTQCFSNFLDNALKFVTPGQPPTVRILAEDLGARVRIWFEDNGIGVPEGCRPLLFQMFQRFHHDYPGTGIGLALVKKAAERMGGTVGLEPRPGHGSRFWIELDRATLSLQ